MSKTSSTIDPSSTWIEAPLEWSLCLKDWLLGDLYNKQIAYWNQRLRDISNRNVDIYQNSDAGFFREFDKFVGIYFRDKVYYPLSSIFWGGEFKTTPYVLELADSDPKLTEEMEVVAQEMDSIKEELHDVTQFLAGFLMFDPPLDVIEEVLGESIGRMCKNMVEKNFEDTRTWTVINPVEMQDFVNESQDIIEKMQQRKLLNLVTL